MLAIGRTWFWNHDRTKRDTNAKVLPLRFANEVAKANTSAIYWLKGEGKGHPQYRSMHRCQEALQSFVGHRRFDLYFQHPWVCGNHISNLLCMAMRQGLKLLNANGTAGAILSLYNMLRQLGPSMTTSIPIMEHLCTLLGDTVFLGPRPTTDFLKIFQRFLGAKVDHTKSRAGRSENKQEWLPSHI